MVDRWLKAQQGNQFGSLCSQLMSSRSTIDQPSCCSCIGICTAMSFNEASRTPDILSLPAIRRSVTVAASGLQPISKNAEAISAGHLRIFLAISFCIPQPVIEFSSGQEVLISISKRMQIEKNHQHIVSHCAFPLFLGIASISILGNTLIYSAWSVDTPTWPLRIWANASNCTLVVSSHFGNKTWISICIGKNYVMLL